MYVTKSTIAGYHLDYNSNGTVADEYSRDDTASPGASYTSWAEIANTYDHDSQLTNTSYASFVNAPSSGTQSFDSSGNRTNVTVPAYLSSNTGAGNRLLFDGTYTYAYDANGNRTMQWKNNSGGAETGPQSGDTDITVYFWNVANELVKVKHCANYSDYYAGRRDRDRVQSADRGVPYVLCRRGTLGVRCLGAQRKLQADSKGSPAR